MSADQNLLTLRDLQPPMGDTAGQELLAGCRAVWTVPLDGEDGAPGPAPSIKIGAVTSSGTLHMIDVVDLPALPPGASRPNVAGGVKIAEYAALEKNEKVIG